MSAIRHISKEAVVWAANQRTSRASEKAVLVALSFHVSDRTMCCFPSIAALAEFACLDRKAVLSALASLAAAGFIIDTNHRMGRTQQVKVWRLNTTRGAE